MIQYLNIVSLEACTGCGACSAICPRSCITIEENTNGFKIPKVNLDLCIHCNLCKKSCPVFDTDSSDCDSAPIKVYAAKNRNIEIAERSSSGGLFSAFAESVLTAGGVVYGVAMCQDLHPEHVRIDNIGNLNKILGSKYLQSDAWKVYPAVREDLILGKHVLFSGTPCQIAALKKYLNKDYPGLLCIEVVCHGVPSNLVFRKYIAWMQAKYGSRVVKVNFRDKSRGWHENSISLSFENGKLYKQRGRDNLYALGYVSNLFVRDSCTDCKFKAFRSRADITLGDMWGIEYIIPSYKIANGVSMVCINTAHGEDAFSRIANDVNDCVEVSYADVSRHNVCIRKSVKEHPHRKEFLSNLHEVPISNLLRKSLDINIKNQLKKKLRGFLTICISELYRIKKMFTW